MLYLLLETQPYISSYSFVAEENKIGVDKGHGLTLKIYGKQYSGKDTVMLGQTLNVIGDTKRDRMRRKCGRKAT